MMLWPVAEAHMAEFGARSKKVAAAGTGRKRGPDCFILPMWQFERSPT